MNKLSTVGLLSLALAAGSAFASPIQPKFDEFAKLDVTYGGSGIPNDPSAITYGKDIDGNVVNVNGQPGLVLGMTATARGSNNPALTNDGAGTYHAVNGAFTPPPGGDTNYARWNFDFSVSGANASKYTYRLYYDFDSAAGTDQNAMGFIQLTNGASQDSWNLGMDFLTTSLYGTPPAFTNFDPGVAGEYSFALVAYNDGKEFARSAIIVDVPEPASLALVGIALLGVAAAGRRRRG